MYVEERQDAMRRRMWGRRLSSTGLDVYVTTGHTSSFLQIAHFLTIHSTHEKQFELFWKRLEDTVIGRCPSSRMGLSSTITGCGHATLAVKGLLVDFVSHFRMRPGKEM
jgi:hypothetical protein